jgi:uncharacterized lipoprotein YehR (DUF1307 family)
MKNIIIRIIISIVVILVISACSKEEESTTIPFTTTCTGSSSGSGPTIGGVTLKEATYKEGSTSFMFVNSTSANVVISGGDSYCYTIDATSTTATMQKINSSGTGVDNVTAYYTTMKQGTWTDTPTTFHMYIYADTDSSFYINSFSFTTKAGADGYPYLLGAAYTKQ